MSLLDIRKKFINDSGRYELITDSISYADAGADAYINSGLRTIENMVEVPQSVSRVYKALETGSFSTEFPLFRIIHQVWVSGSEQKTQLEKLDFGTFRARTSGNVSSMDNGRPIAYTLGHLRASQADDMPEDFLDVIAADPNQSSVLFYPPASEGYTLEVWGYQHFPKLVADEDENFWTVQYPELLVYAALYHLEVSYRNTEGARDWMIALEQGLFPIRADQIIQESSHIMGFEG